MLLTTAISRRAESIETVEAGWAPTLVGTSYTDCELLCAAIFESGERDHQFGRKNFIASGAARDQRFVVFRLFTGHLRATGVESFSPTGLMPDCETNYDTDCQHY